MLIACTNCETSYQVAPSSLGPTGRSVRCARCGYVWFAANTDAMEDIAQSHRGDIATWPDAAIAPRHAAEPTGNATESPPETLAEPEPAQDADLGAADSPGSLTDATLPDATTRTLAPEPPADAPAIEAGINGPAPAGPLAEDIETVAARRAWQQAAKRRRWHASGWSTAILALIAVNLALVGWRANVV